ncbi:MAG: RNA polymerase sigma factor FliA [Sulfuricurvum sp.]|uniref:RNA polymerase sigma factor FliA n=1 Tax=Sulfuricurvum sp. TaxID=2025608 RepID=UPI002728366B|nr:RNA polymerase sigma factor FliA [Sulfuricurvum sp.]MDO9056333.1 RNA polymerase sigma factor FliA [Sulfuricurvum sp.]MDP2849637.1 RNA polymerase sigma factor FliA [Sulfuricurvum sp.]MDP3291460.1 RNA polymerase sigma factor FliA [Sulfuricurvum sp.]
MSGANVYTQELKHREDQLALQFLPAVKAMSFRLKERLPSSIDYMDLCAIGTEELVKLARRYDEAQNDSFWGYAKTRVYGAMLDYLRSLDMVSRSSRRLIKEIDHAIEVYMADHDDEPSDNELSLILGIEEEKVREARIASDIYTVLPLDDQLGTPEEGGVLERLEHEDLIESIQEVLMGFEEREQIIIQLYYFEELTLKEISEIVNITESRISQIHKSVIRRIKEAVGGQ